MSKGIWRQEGGEAEEEAVSKKTWQVSETACICRMGSWEESCPWAWGGGYPRKQGGGSCSGEQWGGQGTSWVAQWMEVTMDMQGAGSSSPAYTALSFKRPHVKPTLHVNACIAQKDPMGMWRLAPLCVYHRNGMMFCWFENVWVPHRLSWPLTVWLSDCN